MVSESTGVFWVRNLIATFLETLRAFSAVGLGPVGACHVVRRALPASSPGLETSGFGFPALLPSPVFMHCGRRTVECGWSLPAVASPFILISFSIAHLDPSSGEIADWRVCPATKAIGKMWPQPEEHAVWKTPSGACNLHSTHSSFHLRENSYAAFVAVCYGQKTLRPQSSAGARQCPKGLENRHSFNVLCFAFLFDCSFGLYLCGLFSSSEHRK